MLVSVGPGCWEGRREDERTGLRPESAGGRLDPLGDTHTHTAQEGGVATPPRVSSGQRVGSLLSLGPSLQIMDRHLLPAPRLLMLI